MSTIYMIAEGEWQGVFGGKLADRTFASEVAALAWLAWCTATGQWWPV